MLCWDTGFAAERAIKRQTLSSPAPVETPYLSGKYRALVIGNNNYDDPEKLWPSLKTAVADAEAVANILKTDYGFAEITLLKNAKQREIVRAFNQLAKTAQDSDSVLIYYAGHGYLNEDTKEGFWLPAAYALFPAFLLHQRVAVVVRPWPACVPNASVSIGLHRQVGFPNVP